jgi:hypothetical protein
VVYAPYCPGALGLESLLQEKVVFSPCSPGALGLESLSQEKATFSPHSPGGLGLFGLEQALACLKECPKPLCSVAKQSTMNGF